MLEKKPVFESRLEALDRQLMDPATAADSRKLREVSREAAYVRDVVDAFREIERMQTELTDAKEMLSASSDEEMRELAREEANSLEGQLETATQKLRLLLLPRDPYEGRPIMLEIRAGTGGDEAALFAADLLRMYQRFADERGLRMEVMATSHITVGGSGKSLTGLKEVVAAVSGDEAYNLLRFEAGVHRVQRVPATESQGRIHTSAATVAVLPEPEEVELKLDPKELRIDTMRAGGPGGQSVNTTDSAVRIVHEPTGIIVICQDEKSQHKNKEKAMRVLKARLLEKQQAEAHAEESAARRAMVGSGDRSERIRTYNFPQNRLTDHRIGLTLYKLDQVVEGSLGELVDALTAEHQAQLLQEQGARLGAKGVAHNLVDILKRTEAWLRNKGVSSPRREAELLLEHVVGLPRLQLYLAHDRPMTDAELAALRPLVTRRGDREPLSWILESRAFHNIELIIQPGVLDPRPDTETLVNAVLTCLPEEEGEAVYIADVGCGSGAVGLAIASARPAVRLYALDLDATALEVTRRNVAALNLTDRVGVLKSDLLKGVPPSRPIDWVVSNPPYIPSGDIDALMPEVSRHEPRLALDGGFDGLQVIERLLREARSRARVGLALEVGHQQAGRVAALMSQHGFTSIETFRDLGDIPRVVLGRVC